MLLYLLGIFFWISLLIQLGFYVFIFRRILDKNEEEEGANTQGFVSVLICARNEYKHLEVLIPQLLEQNYPHFEVLIVNDRSEDASEALLATWAQQDKRLRFITIQETPNHFNPKKYALTQGIHEARGEIILLSDADCRPASKDWIALMQSKMGKKKDIVLGYSPYYKQVGLLNAFIRYETIYTAIQYFSLAIVGFPYMGVGRNLAYRRSVFLKEGGFKGIASIVGGDDDLWINRIARADNVAISLNRNSFMYSFPKTEWRAWFRQKLRHLSVGKYYRLIPKLILGILSLSLLIFWLSFGLIEVLFWAKSYNFLIIAGFLLRLITISSFFTLISRKLEGQLHTISIPIFDFLFVFYIFIIGTLAISIKKIQWE